MAQQTLFLHNTMHLLCGWLLVTPLMQDSVKCKIVLDLIPLYFLKEREIEQPTLFYCSDNWVWLLALSAFSVWAAE